MNRNISDVRINSHPIKVYGYKELKKMEDIK